MLRWAPRARNSRPIARECLTDGLSLLRQISFRWIYWESVEQPLTYCKKQGYYFKRVPSGDKIKGLQMKGCQNNVMVGKFTPSSQAWTNELGCCYIWALPADTIMIFHKPLYNIGDKKRCWRRVSVSSAVGLRPFGGSELNRIGGSCGARCVSLQNFPRRRGCQQWSQTRSIFDRGSMRRELNLTCEKAKGEISFANSDDSRCEGLHIVTPTAQRTLPSYFWQRTSLRTYIELLDFKFIDVHSMDRNSQFMRNPRTRRAVFYPFQNRRGKWIQAGSFVLFISPCSLDAEWCPVWSHNIIYYTLTKITWVRCLRAHCDRSLVSVQCSAT